MSELETLYDKLPTKIKKIALSPDAAGRKITSRVPLATKNQAVSDVRTILFEKTKDYETINYIYVVSKKGVLKGVFSLKEVFNRSPETKIESFMIYKPIKAHLKDDQEKVAHIALKNNLKAIPLVDSKNHFLGILPSDRIHEILDTESKEDLLKLSGIIGAHEDKSIFSSLKSRAPWIVVGLLGGLITARTITSFQGVLEENLILASFIPLIAYVANAVANQSQTLFIRDLATETDISFKKYLAKQMATTIMIAVICWSLIFVITGLIWGTTLLGFIVGFAMTCAIVTATLLALIVPQILKMLKLDPAVGSGPFATVIQDFLSIVIYFSIAEALV